MLFTSSHWQPATLSSFASCPHFWAASASSILMLLLKSFPPPASCMPAMPFPLHLSSVLPKGYSSVVRATPLHAEGPGGNHWLLQRGLGRTGELLPISADNTKLDGMSWYSAASLMLPPWLLDYYRLLRHKQKNAFLLVMAYIDTESYHLGSLLNKAMERATCLIPGFAHGKR